MRYYNTVTKTVAETYIDDATTVAWDDVRVKHFFAPLPIGHRLEYDVNGFPLIVEIPLPTEAELLEQAKSSKLQQIEDDYIASEEQTVEVSGVVYSGGMSSVEAIDSYVRLNRLAGNTTHNIWDVNGVEHSLTDSEVDGVILAIGVQASTNKFTKKNRKVALAVATTIAEVEAI